MIKKPHNLQTKHSKSKEEKAGPARNRLQHIWSQLGRDFTLSGPTQDKKMQVSLIRGRETHRDESAALSKSKEIPPSRSEPKV